MTDPHATTSHATTWRTARLRHALLLCLALACAPLAALHAQATPQQAAEAAMRAMRDDGLPALAAHMHPLELARFKAMLLPLLAPQGADAAPEPVARMMRERFFGPRTSAEAVAAMAPEEFMRRFLGVSDQQMREMGMRVEQFEVIGLVPEGEDMHAVVRSRIGAANGLRSTSMEVVGLRRDGADWKLLLSGEIEGMAQAMRAGAGLGDSATDR